MKAILINLAIICLLFSCLVLATESQSDNEKEFLSDLNLISWLLKKKKSKDFGVLADDDKINCPTNVIKGFLSSFCYLLLLFQENELMKNPKIEEFLILL